LEFLIRKANDADIPAIKGYAERFNLDSEGLLPESLYVTEKNKLLAGFGRHKNYKDFTEIATIGVLEEYRSKGVGKLIVNTLVNTAPLPEIWLATIIPGYFEQFGFKTCNNAPEGLILKAENTCKKVCKCSSNVVFMRLLNQ